jgi:hypothetical protein
MGFITPPEGWEDLRVRPARGLVYNPLMEPPVRQFCGNCGLAREESNRFCAQCGTVHSAMPTSPQRQLAPFNQQPLQQFQPQPQVYVLPQPYMPAAQHVSQHVTIVERDSSSGWLWLAVVLLFPLWPITIPIAIIVLIVRLFRD